MHAIQERYSTIVLKSSYFPSIMFARYRVIYIPPSFAGDDLGNTLYTLPVIARTFWLLIEPRLVYMALILVSQTFVQSTLP